MSERLRSPVNLPRRLVADAVRVYVTLGYHAAVSILDAATGTVVRTCDGTDRLMALDAASGQLRRKY